MTACSALAEELGEDLAASAPKAGRFLLLEQPGPWTGRNAVTHSDLDEGIGRALLARADEADVKVHLIRRSSRRAALERRSCFLADVARGWVERHELGDPADVLELDLSMRGERWERPLYLACTHGKRDPCCAQHGRPLARALRARWPEETWEIGHIGGHRFAATMLTFPHGLAFGRVRAASGPEIVSALEAGEIVLEHLRGRAGDPWQVQAAEVLVRRELGLGGLDALAVEAVDGDTVTLRRDDGTRVRATVARRDDPRPRPLSCGDEPDTVSVFELVELA
ncbi:MAG TPA: sucrase ferredoxin [Solirubrobacteraceae bacterium]|nr:sucrase ferredoxin [Solirubrobacteraceae bacterium]